MTLQQKLNEKIGRLDELGEVLDDWSESYNNGSSFPERPEWNSNSHKLSVIKQTVDEMVILNEQIEVLEEVIEEVKKI